MTSDSDEDTWRNKLARSASIAKLGGRPPDDPLASWFGRVLVGHRDEAWPHFRDKPLVPICQINLAESPFRPEILSDIVLLSIFITEDFSYIDQVFSDDSTIADGPGWCVRAYSSVEELEPIAAPEADWAIKPFPITFELVETDYPTHELLPLDMPEDLRDRYYDFGWEKNWDNTKLGGWPSCCQSEPSWLYTPGVTGYEFVLQIAGESKAEWYWGDEGNIYLARHKTQPNRWAFDWQCL